MCAVCLVRLSLTSPFFWLVVITTSSGLLFSFSEIRTLEGAGAAKVGSLLLHVLIVSIGMQMNIARALQNPAVLLTLVLWMAFHVAVMFAVAKIVKAPLFYLAVGSTANIGGAITAPLVAAAFDPALAPIAVLLSVAGYAIGTYAGFSCGLLLCWVNGAETCARLDFSDVALPEPEPEPVWFGGAG